MKNVYCIFTLIGTLGMASVVQAQTIYKGVEKRGYPQPQVNHHPNPVFNHQAPQQHVPNHRPPHGHHPYPPPMAHRPQVSIVTPQVGIYVNPQPSYSYQTTEEVYLPYGGTYRSVTEYIPQTTYPPISKRRVIKSGSYDANHQQ